MIIPTAGQTLQNQALDIDFLPSIKKEKQNCKNTTMCTQTKTEPFPLFSVSMLSTLQRHGVTVCVQVRPGWDPECKQRSPLSTLGAK